jgi:hypothetical protein
LFVVGLVFGFGCASADDASVENDTASDETLQSEEVGSTEGEIGTAEQAIIPILIEPGPAQQCVSACTRVSTTNLTGLCCVCNGAVKTFRRHPAITSMYLCM